MLRYKNRVEQMIAPDLEKLFVVRIHRINEALAPGLYIHDWYSSLFDKWIAVSIDRVISPLTCHLQCGRMSTKNEPFKQRCGVVSGGS